MPTAPTSGQPLPRIVVVGTGGTIAGSSAATTTKRYQAGVLGVADLLAAVPSLAEVAEIRCEQLYQIDSVEMDLPRQLDLARAVSRLAAEDDVDAVVVTHGTDTLEETAYALHLLVDTDKPVVVVGAMRPADAAGADGPGNLLAAVRVAAHPTSRGLGALVVVGEEIHSARDVRKEHTSRVDAFGSLTGPLGELAGGVPRYAHIPARRHGAATAVTLAAIDQPAAVEVLVTRAELPPQIVDAVVASGARGIVHAGPGAGNVPERVAAALDRARSAGVVVVRSSRVAWGTVARGDAFDDDGHDFVAAADLGPYKARVLLALALTITDDPARLQQIFDTH
ncbi:asparaginase [Arsenicicoccus sp. oral taxon 190]|uniref:asparaginase n=1 Tax=Arsenicicoccus sp. oral taxon 190 TaxID=1658671 RepID=UPI00067A05DA|nr:asparaginase [Arsenicicoccus sp. oral taxon 190]AKT51915.1 hypothetical protein ADJ73_12655 [Arsenicicoccus sp. oral taxon 190]